MASFEKALEALKAASHFHLLSFEALVKSLHATVAERLWRLIMEEADLVKHLRAVRDLVLMGHGALWREIIVQGRDLMRHPPTTRSEESLRTGPLAAVVEDVEWMKTIMPLLDYVSCLRSSHFHAATLILWWASHCRDVTGRSGYACCPARTSIH